MRSAVIFAIGLGILPPWEVKSVSFEDTQDSKELHIHIDFSCGVRFVNEKGESVCAYDTEDKEYAHHNHGLDTRTFKSPLKPDVSYW